MTRASHDQVAAWSFVIGCAWIKLADLAWLQDLANSSPALALDAVLSPMREYDVRGQA